MPSPRSVLIDIHDMGLDPEGNYRQTNASGRLKNELAEISEAKDVSDETMSNTEDTTDVKPETGEEQPEAPKRRVRKQKTDVTQ